ncbi:MAG: hypothetical protein NWF06_04870 [Candidatus Bathyarchaeota archaeon]|nr:hypothetical protein [Candidatus Bathyarchaeum sp.]
MGEKNSSNQLTIVLGITCVVLAVIIVLMASNIIPTLDSNREAKLVNVGLGARDMGQTSNDRILRIEGYVCNVGIETAYKTRLHVVSDYAAGGNAIDTYIDIGIGNGGVIYGGDSTKVSIDIPYSADAALGSWTLTPIWSNTP